MSKSRKMKHFVYRAMVTGAMMLLLVGSVSAYTIVMRGGKRVEIPSQFLVTANTVTYEAGPGIQITLQLAAIDIAATEKANNETPGSFMRRLEAVSSKSLTATGVVAPSARRTITNRELEASMIRRTQSESAYEKRRKELGLPTVAESRRRAESESVEIQSDLERIRQTEKESESYWRSRASALRTEIAAVDAELNYVRIRLEDLSPTLVSGFTSFSVPFIAPGISFGRGGFRRQFPGSFGSHRPLVYSAPGGGTQIRGRAVFGGRGTRAGVWLNSGGFSRRTFGGSGFPISPFPVVSTSGYYGSTLQAYDYEYDRGALITQFNELGMRKAGLRARWRELEEEARRAGVPPGWLRE